MDTIGKYAHIDGTLQGRADLLRTALGAAVHERLATFMDAYGNPGVCPHIQAHTHGTCPDLRP